jgi:hypothetical protein
MNYSPKLKTAMERIKAILKEYDIAAQVILHTPGFSEYLTKVEASYSCAKFEGDFLRVKAKLQEDFDGDKVAQIQKLTDTVNMITHFKDVNANMFLGMDKLLGELQKTIDIETTGGGHTSHTTQNN